MRSTAVGSPTTWSSSSRPITGEELFDHGWFEHGHSVYNELLRVPLVVRGPGIRPARHDIPVSLLDLYPTILETFGHAVPDDVPGRSLWPVLIGEEPLPGPSFVC